MRQQSLHQKNSTRNYNQARQATKESYTTTESMGKYRETLNSKLNPKHLEPYVPQTLNRACQQGSTLAPKRLPTSPDAQSEPSAFHPLRAPFRVSFKGPVKGPFTGSFEGSYRAFRVSLRAFKGPLYGLL